MESLSGLPSYPPFPSRPEINKPMSKASSFVPISLPSFCNFSCNSISRPSTSRQSRFHLKMETPLLSQAHWKNHEQVEIMLENYIPNIFRNNYLKPHFSFLFFALGFPLSSFASETTVPSGEVASKINIEAILVSIDDFFNRNPFFVAGVTFIWLVVIPLTQEYLSKYKFISAIDAFRKLRDDPNSQLLDIRDNKSLRVLGSPNLKILNKLVMQVEFCEGDEEGFVKKVLEKFVEPADTTICILDNFDGNSMKAAELLVQNGFKEAYAIRGGIRGKNGWQEIQETLLPPSVHIYPKKMAKLSQHVDVNGGVNQSSENNQASPDAGAPTGKSLETDDEYIKKPIDPTPLGKHRSLSPYPNYPDFKPPSSPTPSKPEQR